ncbi:hypothetical protein NDU88_005353 [Pleurodeles waltl]|uniref:Uncharacterized protein n=1 Tax=Pleurodeles waltl TaxID=8319 RepID=A0AAV7PIA9_PLEWA|nr:hypothetical protein NDU88_005353 [Pleurodeles waltl]
MHISEAQAKAEKGADARVCSPDISIGTRNTDSEMLQFIYESIKELQTETRVESHRARMATKRLQGTVHKVVKSCIEIVEKLSTIEERTMATKTVSVSAMWISKVFQSLAASTEKALPPHLAFRNLGTTASLQEEDLRGLA